MATHPAEGDCWHGADPAEGLRASERRLQAAQLASDVEVLDEPIDERLVFTGPDGALHTKADDLHIHRSGDQVMNKVVEEDLTVIVAGRTGVTLFLGTVEGRLRGEPFSARVRYTRTWHRGEHGWRLLAAHVSAA
ncbi:MULTISPECIES: nuclear transport factor 2 family protein [Frankia]|uniref:DUF4440 domain-containing protein n=1 Tax=Frankia alni (strain DSM 45986 / CECT 9034 / ACN14a) TaxID=326424 RepID=Q0RLC8_FRAAA|nr:hypothetical protein FRAAL3033 [Frankia alni ACN14a]